MADSTDPAEAARLEAGRLMFARPWTFRLGVNTIDGIPAAEGVEVAFAGRSNVGKSSLINALTGQNTLARTSNTPGRTRQLNFFVSDTPLTIVDMPGYGYARASKTDVAAWTDMVFAYLRGRPNLRRVYLLIDSRHGLKTADDEALDLMDQTAVSYQIVLTKCDKPKPGQLQQIVERTETAVGKRPAAHPRVLTTSSQNRDGLDLLRAEIAEIARP